MFDSTDQLAVNAIRTLSIDQIERAKSGHPGLPMGAAPMLYVLWTRHLRINPEKPDWINRDRFVLSAGHGSAGLYSLLHLSGFDLSIEDLKEFRQLGSKTPGHPEIHHPEGVDANTGPLGQGLANAVGMAMAEKHLAGLYNTKEEKIVDHYSYVLCGDGCLMEGISYEACSLAGHLKLGKLILLYDSNDISLDGPLNKAFSDDIKGRFESSHWHYQRVDDGNDLEAIDQAIKNAKEERDKPSIIEIKTIIGFGSQKQGTQKVHGAALEEEDVKYTKENYSWPYENFEIPDAVYECFKEKVKDRGIEENKRWEKTFSAWKEKNPDKYEDLKKGYQAVDIDWDGVLPVYDENHAPIATRSCSSDVIQAISEKLPQFWGGSADLSSSNKTVIKSSGDFSSEDRKNRNIWYGAREFAMACAMNGILAHGGTRTYVSTFLAFSDYMKSGIRLAALSGLPSIFVFTHDSVAVGEDGPTHQPIEQISDLRSIPRLQVFRPADGNETAQAWRLAMESQDKPSALVLTRQTLPTLKGSKEKAGEGVRRGAYVISPQEGDKADGIMIATGSEVSLAIEAQKVLKEKGIDSSVVSMPSMELFDEQDDDYKEKVLPKNIRKRLSIEMGTSFGWQKYTGLDGKNLCIDEFGVSGKAEDVKRHFGFTVENIVETFMSL